ncbi:TorF family putative porin [Asticcacaulis endophyticus]|uniref:DUF2490 domain-containing protein n=1 Tax=Asticcacaulis endophyticus TaxID=1395890 RepID=A0A918Q7J5_9CAUL|nr:TorF family putative porin [Asticcacaulis endophyticus]GGZ33376.1 hypothetical protein GCM10011273_19600 [Asticcacaulis endophyticus]
MSVSVKATALSTFAAISALALPLSAQAETLKFSAEVKGLTDGIYRGVSQTEGLPQYIAGAQVAYGKVFVGTLFKSMRDRTTGVDNQTQALIGYKTKFNGTDITARAIYKQYNGVRPGIDDEFMEYEVNLSRKVSDKLTGKLNLAYSPDNYGNRAKQANFVEIGVDYKLTPRLSLQAAGGFRHVENGTDYTSYLVGATYAVTKTLNASLTYTHTDKADLGDKYGDATFITLSKKF